MTLVGNTQVPVSLSIVKIIIRHTHSFGIQLTRCTELAAMQL